MPAACPRPTAGSRLVRGIPADVVHPGAWVETKSVGYPTPRWLRDRVAMFDALRRAGVVLAPTAEGRCGSYGCVFDVERIGGKPVSGLVAKLTGDPTEAAASQAAIAARAAGVELPALADIRCVYSVLRARLFIVLMEALAPLRPEERRFLTIPRERAAAEASAAVAMRRAARGDDGALRAATVMAHGAGVDPFEVRAIVGTMRAMRAAGIVWIDLHGGNVLRKPGAPAGAAWRIVDLGVSRVDAQRVPRLADLAPWGPGGG